MKIKVNNRKASDDQFDRAADLIGLNETVYSLVNRYIFGPKIDIFFARK